MVGARSETARLRQILRVRSMGLLRRKASLHLIPIHRDNTINKDWLILLEAATIVGPASERLRVARSTQERQIVKKYNIAFRAQYFLVVEGYNPRIHTLYLCPQLYRYDSDKKLVPLQGDEMGKLIAQSVESGVAQRRPWYQPGEALPDQPIVGAQSLPEFDTVVVDMPSRNVAATGT
jgi:hypothetical protein